MFLLPEDYWEVRETKTKGRGIFAKQEIIPGTVIGDYLGQLIKDAAFDELTQGLYTMYYNKETSISPNPREAGIHLINHSCSSNCEMFPYKGHTLYFATRRIFPGEELTVRYLLDPPEPHHVCTHICYCESVVCHGTMHTTIAIQKNMEAFVKELGELVYEETLPVPIGEQIPPLAVYPPIIEDNPFFDLFGAPTQNPLLCDETSLPPLHLLRKIIRESGRVLQFEKIGISIYGIMNSLIVAMDSE